MKAMKAGATAALAVLLLVCLAAAEAVALLQYTLMNPAFVGEGEKDAYEFAGRAVVRKLSDGILAGAPPIVLRTTDRELAYEMASEALPPGKISGMLRLSAPEVDRFLFTGGDVPVLKGSADLNESVQAAVKSLLMPDAWALAQSSVTMPALPFTPEWNQGNGGQLNQSLWFLRYYAGFTDETFWLAVAGVVMMSGLLYLTWLKERKPFFQAVGCVLTLNGVILLAPALAVSFWSADISRSLAGLPALSGVAVFFGGDFEGLFRAVVWPFRSVFFVSSLTSLALGLTMFSAGMEEPLAEELPEKPWLMGRAARQKKGMNALGVRKPRHARP